MTLTRHACGCETGWEQTKTGPVYVEISCLFSTTEKQDRTPHAFELKAPGLHGPASVSGVCSCKHLLRSVFPREGEDLDEVERELVALWDAHLKETQEASADARRYHGHTFVAAQVSTSHYAQPGYGAAPSVPQTRGPEPFPVLVVDAETGDAALYSHGYPASPGHRPKRVDLEESSV